MILCISFDNGLYVDANVVMSAGLRYMDQR